MLAIPRLKRNTQKKAASEHGCRQQEDAGFKQCGLTPKAKLLSGHFCHLHLTKLRINQSSRYLQHPHQDISAVAAFLLTLGADAVHQVQQEFAGHGLDAAGQGLIIDVLCEELDSEGQVTEGQVLANVVYKVSKCAVGEGSAGRDVTVLPVAAAGTAVLREEGPAWP